ncbi:hypothetical protein [Azospirillum sp. sgz302134]
MTAVPPHHAAPNPAAQAAILNEFARRIRLLGQDLSALSTDLAALAAVAEGRAVDDPPNGARLSRESFSPEVQTSSSRHPREGGGPENSAHKWLKGLDPRLRGDDEWEKRRAS